MIEFVQAFMNEVMPKETIVSASKLREIPNPYRHYPTQQFIILTDNLTTVVSVDTLSNKQYISSIYGSFVNHENTNIDDFLSVLDKNNENILLAKAMESNQERFAEDFAALLMADEEDISPINLKE